MEIESPTLQHIKKYHIEQSIKDACFHPKSHYLISSQQSHPLIIDYSFSFGQIKSGILEKKTLNSNWQNRYFVLTPIRLLYFADQTRQQLKGCFNLASLTQHKLQLQSFFPQISLTVKFQCQGQLYTKILITLQILNQSIYNEWLKCLKQVLIDIKLNLLHLSIFPKIAPSVLMDNHQKIGKSNYNFWNKINISFSELLNYGSHLDILFLRSKSAFSCIHRFFMRSYYDHVGILLKDQMEQPYLLEVVNQKGVIISPLRNLISSCSQEYEEIGYRKLLSQTNLLPLQSLQNYVNSLIGKKYELTLSKIFLDNQTQLQNAQQDSGISQSSEKPQKTYFCSELIADIYLKFGVLPKGKSNNFWPKDFEEEQLTLSQGYSLTPMMHIDMEEVKDNSVD